MPRGRAIGAFAVAFAFAAGAAAAPRGGFFDAVGVNTHVYALNTPYGDLPAVLAALRYLGIRHVRDNPPARPRPERYRALEAAGIGLDLLARSDAEPPLALYDALAPGLDDLEGPNEVNAHPDSLLYHGLTGFPAAVLLQQNLFGAARADGRLRDVPVVMFSAVYHGPADLPPYPPMARATLANVHAYPPGAAAPPAEYLPGDVARWSRAVPGAPVLVTEFGYFTWPGAPRGAGVTEDVQAKWTLDALADGYFAGGIARQYVYELVDQAADDAAPDKENHFGLFGTDWRPKPAAVALHDLRQILGDAGAGPAAAVINGLPPGGRAGVLADQRGVYVLLWRENRIGNPSAGAKAAPPSAVTVTFPRPAPLAVFDPLRGATPVVQMRGARVTVPLAEDLLVVRAG